MAWRMGAGESYLEDFAFWTSLLSQKEVNRYIEHYPEPKEWEGFYEENRRVVEGRIEEWRSFGFYQTKSGGVTGGG
ncbi:MAG: hypothetical protein AAFY77_04630 [Pseudomonadota bacterium]